MKKLLLFCCLAGSLMACMTFNTNVNRAAIPQFSRVLIVSRLPVNPTDLLTEFVATFPKQYTVCTVNADKLAFGNPDSLIRQKVRECGSEVLLTINLERDHTTGGGNYIQSVREVYLEMTNLANGKSFWKAVGTSEGNLYPRQVVVQLRDDGIITGKIPPAPSTDNTAYH
jgi:hypothetical protein